MAKKTANKAGKKNRKHGRQVAKLLRQGVTPISRYIRGQITFAQYWMLVKNQ